MKMRMWPVELSEAIVSIGGKDRAVGGERHLNAVTRHEKMAPFAKKRMLLLLAMVVGAQQQQQQQQCPAGLCGEKKRRCVAWRQTAQCTPRGRREPHMDRDCDAVIPDGTSGYCECDDGSKARASPCRHGPFTCARACASYDRELCMGGFEASRSCEADGPRDEKQDRSCRDVIPDGLAGQCLCGQGRRVKRSGCEAEKHAQEPLTCDEACGAPETLYEIMGISSDADEQTLKQAWRGLSRSLHPDKVRQFATNDVDEEELSERFAEVRLAYDVLGDPARREAYDSGGAAFLAKFDEKRGDVPRAPDVTADTHVTLETLYHGANLSVSIDRRVVCRHCADGDRDRFPVRCSKCPDRCPDEYVTVKARLGPFVVDQQQRQRSRERCRTDRLRLDFTVEPGAPDGDVITFSGDAPQLPNALLGDVHLRIHQTDHPSFVRHGDDLHTTVHISLRDALVGFHKQIRHVGGHHVDIVSDAIITPGLQVRIPREGMPRSHDSNLRGDLLVEYDVLFPSSLDPNTKNFVATHFPN